MTVRYAVVGVGWISQIAFLPGVDLTGNSKTTALVSGKREAADRLAKFYDIAHVYSYDQYDEMLAADVVDAVYIALPNAMHADYAIRAVKAGKHVIVEKPLAVSVAECEAMIAAADGAGVFLMTAYRLHNEPGTVHALDLIRAGAIGDPRLFTSLFSFQARAANHRLKASNWGGPLQDIGIYCVNAVRHVFADEPFEVMAARNHVDDPRFAEVEESFAATMMFPKGRIAQFSASFGAEQLHMYRIAGTEGDISVECAFDFQSPTIVRLTRGAEVIEHEFEQTDQFAGQTAYFSDCIKSGVAPEPDGAEGLADVAILLALEEAAKTGVAQKVALHPRDRHPDKAMVRRIAPTVRRLMI
ncbi:glucose-fructose oxidoreductase oxidoreductase [Agrobacterium tumefaciens]|uniref:Gfo/Idh/MocA family protein n=1 Tax=Agrobacterium tumefaciens TaxID=358 RepID=UPI00080F7FF9|nr:glucose-fructose oxidoreductase oxidoreductase [Agrobacterium tumefaciens]